MGARRDAVSAAQRLLNQAGASLSADGRWGPLTDEAYARAPVATQQAVNAVLAKAELSPDTIRRFQKNGGDENKAAFRDRVVPAVRRAAKARGLNGDLMVAQLRLESGGGGSIPPGSNNWGGIKASKGSPSVTARTKEFSRGQLSSTTANFRKFESPEAFADYYVGRLAALPRYKAAYSQSDAKVGATLLGSSGYATDPAYASKLHSMLA